MKKICVLITCAFLFSLVLVSCGTDKNKVKTDASLTDSTIGNSHP